MRTVCADPVPAAGLAPGLTPASGLAPLAADAAQTVLADDWLELWPEVLAEAAVTAEELDLALIGLLTDPTTDEVRLPAGPDSSSRARRLILSVLESWGLDGLGEVAEQLVSELIANVVRHTGGRSFGLRVARRQGGVRFEVRDPSRALPCLILGDPEDDSGRGLQLVNLLSDRWGADLMSRGKSVWFELRGTPARTE
ncbi:ATP-binding protein [Streptacidiphilus cavernicola]|uniref:ATP-binding protein n=1 Tax=Streptacidiphilus cavernicola TaxID=3342716 RepID=A0ABV6W2J1_9ACTN